MIQYQILQTNITRTVWQTVRRITNEILGVKGWKYWSSVISLLFFLSLKVMTRVDLEEITCRQVQREPTTLIPEIKMVLYLPKFSSSASLPFCLFYRWENERSLLTKYVWWQVLIWSAVWLRKVHLSLSTNCATILMKTYEATLFFPVTKYPVLIKYTLSVNTVFCTWKLKKLPVSIWGLLVSTL